RRPEGNLPPDANPGDAGRSLLPARPVRRSHRPSHRDHRHNRRILDILERAASLTPRRPMLSEAQTAAIDRLFAGWTAQTPGGVIALLRDVEVVLQRCHGLANLEHEVPITEATRFPICSITKTFT